MDSEARMTAPWISWWLLPSYRQCVPGRSFASSYPSLTSIVAAVQRGLPNPRTVRVRNVGYLQSIPLFLNDPTAVISVARGALGRDLPQVLRNYFGLQPEIR